MTIGESIKFARKDAGLTQAQLAEKCGVAKITIQQYERGVRQPSLQQIQRLAIALNLDIIDLLTASSATEALHQDAETLMDRLGHNISDLDDLATELEETPLDSSNKQIYLERFNEIKRNCREVIKDSDEYVSVANDMQKYLEQQIATLESGMQHCLIENYNHLNIDGKIEAIKQVGMLTELPQYQRRTDTPQSSETTSADTPTENSNSTAKERNNQED